MRTIPFFQFLFIPLSITWVPAYGRSMFLLTDFVDILKGAETKKECQFRFEFVLLAPKSARCPRGSLRLPREG